jgi:hypothetical protein
MAHPTVERVVADTWEDARAQLEAMGIPGTELSMAHSIDLRPQTILASELGDHWLYREI